VKGKYVVFTVDSASSATDWTLTGAPNPSDLTASYRRSFSPARFLIIDGLALTSDVSVESDRESPRPLSYRPGTFAEDPGQKDCANGGVSSWNRLAPTERRR